MIQSRWCLTRKSRCHDEPASDVVELLQHDGKRAHAEFLDVTASDHVCNFTCDCVFVAFHTLQQSLPIGFNAGLSLRNCTMDRSMPSCK